MLNYFSLRFAVGEILNNSRHPIRSADHPQVGVARASPTLPSYAAHPIGFHSIINISSMINRRKKWSKTFFMRISPSIHAVNLKTEFWGILYKERCFAASELCSSYYFFLSVLIFFLYSFLLCIFSRRAKWRGTNGKQEPSFSRGCKEELMCWM